MPFIVTEGLDGSGGETHSKFLVEWLNKKGIKAVRIKSPDYSTPVGQVYDKYLHENFDMPKEAVFLLCGSDVIINKPLIEKAKRENTFIIADRYITSTIAFQGANGFPFDKALKSVEIMEFPKADMIIYMDISPETSMKRKQKEKGDLDKHEKDKQFLYKVKEFYKREIDSNVLGEWLVIDCERPIDEIQKDMIRILTKKFKIR